MDKKIIGLDWGTKNVGVALYTPTVGYVTLTTIPNKSFHLLVDEIIKIKNSHQVDVIVIGGTGRVNTKTQVQKLAKVLSAHSEVIVFNEYLSSRQAEMELREHDKIAKAKLIHGISAQQILREYIESLVSSQNT